MSNFFIKSLKEKKNVKSDISNSFKSSPVRLSTSERLPTSKKYKKSLENNEKDFNGHPASPKHKKKFMITPPNENLYRKKNFENDNLTHQKDTKLYENSPAYTGYEHNSNTHNYKKNYRLSPRKINYTNDEMKYNENKDYQRLQGDYQHHSGDFQRQNDSQHEKTRKHKKH